MLILNIKEKGRYLHFPGHKPFRTPVKMDITNLDLAKILLYLKTNNVIDYEIISSLIEEKTEKVKPKKEENIVTNIKELIDKDKEQMTNRLDRIEGLIKGLFNRTTSTNVLDKVLQEPVIDETDTFIPNVNIDNFKSSKEASTTVSNKRDLRADVELLKNLSKKE